jgi:hypothetical protein
MFLHSLDLDFLLAENKEESPELDRLQKLANFQLSMIQHAMKCLSSFVLSVPGCAHS